MPSASRKTASETIQLEGVEVHLENFAHFPRWGYVVRGQIEFRLASGEETYRAGDAYYVPPGHTPVHYAGTEIVEFTPTKLLGEAMAVVMRNLPAASTAGEKPGRMS